MSDTDDGALRSDGDVAGARRVAPWVAGLVAVVMASLLVLLFVNRGRDTNDESANTPLMSQPAPDVEGSLPDGTPFQLSRRKGSWVVLNFFRHNCVPCIVEHPELIDFVDRQRALGTEGAEFYTVVQQSTREQVDAFFAERGGDWPVVYDDKFEFQIEFGVVKQPETWVIDPNGIVRARYATTVDADGLSATIQSLRETL